MPIPFAAALAALAASPAAMEGLRRVTPGITRAVQWGARPELARSLWAAFQSSSLSDKIPGFVKDLSKQAPGLVEQAGRYMISPYISPGREKYAQTFLDLVKHYGYR